MLAGEPIRPLPQAIAEDPVIVALGRDLFVEPALSQDGRVRCVDCHRFARGGADPRGRSIGTDGQEVPVQAPSVFNLAFNHCYNWDGQTCELAAHAELPLFNPRVMGMTEALVLSRLTATGAYAERFAASFADGLTVANVGRALAAYERTLVTPNAAIDRHLRGEVGALRPAALAGYRRFKELGCVSCHQGTNVGGNLFQRFGVFGDFTAERAGGAAYTGRHRATGREEDRGVFRVPSLRNVALTAPYFHDGSVATLAEAVAIMGRYQLGESLSAGDVAAIVEFLAALTGELPEEPGDE
jgi:cytochrome c peroxidase